MHSDPRTPGVWFVPVQEDDAETMTKTRLGPVPHRFLGRLLASAVTLASVVVIPACSSQDPNRSVLHNHKPVNVSDVNQIKDPAASDSMPAEFISVGNRTFFTATGTVGGANGSPAAHRLYEASRPTFSSTAPPTVRISPLDKATIGDGKPSTQPRALRFVPGSTEQSPSILYLSGAEVFLWRQTSVPIAPEGPTSRLLRADAIEPLGSECLLAGSDVANSILLHRIDVDKRHYEEIPNTKIVGQQVLRMVGNDANGELAMIVATASTRQLWRWVPSQSPRQVGSIVPKDVIATSEGFLIATETDTYRLEAGATTRVPNDMGSSLVVAAITRSGLDSWMVASTSSSTHLWKLELVETTPTWVAKVDFRMLVADGRSLVPMGPGFGFVTGQNNLWDLQPMASGSHPKAYSPATTSLTGRVDRLWPAFAPPFAFFAAKTSAGPEGVELCLWWAN